MEHKKPKKVVAGIPFFSEDRYWGKIPQAAMEQAVALIEEKGWEEFLSTHQHQFDFTFEENRADFRFVMPISEQFNVLDIGAGLGRISIPLARVAKKVVALDQSFLRMKFLALRAAKEQLKNIEVYVGDIFDQPFSEESFDLVVMNGVLEWVGMTERFRSPREAQIESLAIARRLLKPGGYLYIGIENRFALSYLKAADHSGLRFTSYLPRWLADAYQHLRLGRRYDTYTYTKRGYEKLLNQAGLKKIEFYLPYPGYNFPRLMIPYKNIQALRYAVISLMPALTITKKAVRLLVRLPYVAQLYRYLFFSFGIVAQK